VFLATGLGVGLSPWMPGTIGSLWGPPLVWLLQSTVPSGELYAALACGLIALGVPLCARASDRLGIKDPGCIVYDEIAAFLVVYASREVDVRSAVSGFLLFRAADILKPWPVRQLERLPGGYGIMADDLAAGVFAAIGLWLIDLAAGVA
jgi:phosphatidylglycerophosphatase A